MTEVSRVNVKSNRRARAWGWMIAFALLTAAIGFSQGCGTSTGKVTATNTPTVAPSATFTPAGTATNTSIPTPYWHMWPTTTPLWSGSAPTWWSVVVYATPIGTPGLNWIVGTGGHIVVNNGGSNWVPSTISSTNDLYAVTDDHLGHAWAAGATGFVAHWDSGPGWVAGNPAPTCVSVYGVSAFPMSNPTPGFYACGAAGHLFAFVGTAASGPAGVWTPIAPVPAGSPTVPAGDFYGIAPSAGHIWCVGLGGAIVDVAPALPVLAATPYASTLYAVAAGSGGEAYAVGAGGTGVKYVLSSWTSISTTSATSQTLNGISVVQTGGSDWAWAVGNNGTIIRSTDGGATWATQTAPTSANLTSVSMTSTTSGWAVGTNGVILQYY